MGVIEYRVMTGEDTEEVIRLMDDVFFMEEIISKSLDFETPRETRAYHEAMMPICLQSGLSIVAVEQTEKRIVGAILNITTTKEIPNEFQFSLTGDLTWKLATMDKVYDPVYDGVDFYEMYNTPILVANRGLCVARSHRRQGIGITLFRKSIELIRESGYKCYCVEATSAYTRSMMDRLGFHNIAEKHYSELLVNGKQIVTDTSIHSSLSLHAIDI